MKKINEHNLLGIKLQFLVTVVVAIVGVIAIFKNKFFPYFQLAMGFDLFLLAYNNAKVYQKNKMTLIYVVFGILLICSALLALLGVI